MILVDTSAPEVQKVSERRDEVENGGLLGWYRENHGEIRNSEH